MLLLLLLNRTGSIQFKLSVSFNETSSFVTAATAAANSADSSSSPSDCGSGSDSGNDPLQHAARELLRSGEITEAEFATIVNTYRTYVAAKAAAATAASSAVASSAVPDVEWLPDTNLCQLCLMNFTLLNRRHHCRLCGINVCGACSSHADTTAPAPIPNTSYGDSLHGTFLHFSIPILYLNGGSGGGKLVRVCSNCFKKTAR